MTTAALFQPPLRIQREQSLSELRENYMNFFTDFGNRFLHSPECYQRITLPHRKVVVQRPSTSTLNHFKRNGYSNVKSSHFLRGNMGDGYVILSQHGSDALKLCETILDFNDTLYLFITEQPLVLIQRFNYGVGNKTRYLGPKNEASEKTLTKSINWRASKRGSIVSMNLPLEYSRDHLWEELRKMCYIGTKTRPAAFAAFKFIESYLLNLGYRQEAICKSIFHIEFLEDNNDLYFGSFTINDFEKNHHCSVYFNGDRFYGPRIIDITDRVNLKNIY